MEASVILAHFVSQLIFHIGDKVIQLTYNDIKSLINDFANEYNKPTSIRGGYETIDDQNKDLLIKKMQSMEKDESFIIQSLSWIPYITAGCEKMFFMGPSGSGKTQLISSLQACMNNQINFVERSTDNVTKSTLVVDGSRKAVFDNHGQTIYREFSIDDNIEALIQNSPQVIVIVMAGGFLQAANASPFTRPSPEGTSDYTNKAAFLAATKKEELDWLNALKNKLQILHDQQRESGSKQKYLINGGVKHVVLVINKMDLWFDEKDTVEEFYREASFYDSLKQITELVVLPIDHLGNVQVAPIILPCASIFNHFKKLDQPELLQLASGKMSVQKMIFSLKILRAYLCLL